jgi:uncharacterized protein involved in exopolysaccharide biosynthesis
MSHANRPSLSPKEVARLLATYPKRWIVPAAAIAVAAVVYAFVASATWESTQALIVRNEATARENGQGKFRQPEDMKTVQETILELVRSRGVLEAALKTVGPPANYKGTEESWPTDRDIAALRKRVRMTPPKGGEFGKTEVFYLEVKDNDRGRTVTLNSAICDQLEARFKQLRDAKAQSMIDELAKTVAVAKADLATTTARVTEIEKQVGGDLAELRSLDQSAGSDSALRRTGTEIRAELREITTTITNQEELLSLLRAAQNDPTTLVATPNRLLDSQPALRRLKDGLVDAHLHAAKLQGTMSAEHPVVQAAQEAAAEIARSLHRELAVAIRGVEADCGMSRDRANLLEEQLAKVNGRLDRLSGLRASYANEAAENANRLSLLERAEQNLAEARAAHASARATSLISRIDSAEAGINPVGLTKASIMLLGIAAGLLAGFGVLYLTVPTAAPTVAASPVAVEATSFPPAVKPNLPINGKLTVKQALEKIAFGSRV